ncbi:MAG TPA: hypothetical protein VIX86_11630, partial [Streptosporangiaceae bacterium]
LTHAPPRGVGDRADPPHQGFEALNRLTEWLRPAVLLHGHIHPDGFPAAGHRLGATVVCNVAGRHLLDIQPGAGARHSPAAQRHA